MKCLACDIDKDMSVLEIYPFNDDYDSAPILPLLEMDCEPAFLNSRWKRIFVCHKCFHELDPDMWISQSMWESLNPVVTFDDLPDADT